MKAVFFQKHGGNEVLEYGDRPLPEPGAGDVRVSIRAAALNHLDIFVRDGIPGVPLPQIPGADGAGVVDALGAGVEGLSAVAAGRLSPRIDNVFAFSRAKEAYDRAIARKEMALLLTRSGFKGPWSEEKA